MTNPAPQPNPDAAQSVARLTELLQRQNDVVKNSKTTLGAAWQAMKYSREIEESLDTSLTALHMLPNLFEKPLETLQRIVTVADMHEIDTGGIKKLLPTIEAIAEKVEAERAGPLKTIQIARKHLRG